jgi:hypothetical protein
MELIQLLLPVQDEHGRAYSRALYDDLVHRLTDRFGGVTAYTRSPATGLWESPSGETVRDVVVVYEVMVEGVDGAWWQALRTELETRFGQDEIVIRAQPMRRL